MKRTVFVWTKIREYFGYWNEGEILIYSRKKNYNYPKIIRKTGVKQHFINS